MRTFSKYIFRIHTRTREIYNAFATNDTRVAQHDVVNNRMTETTDTYYFATTNTVFEISRSFVVVHRDVTTIEIRVTTSSADDVSRDTGVCVIVVYDS